MQENQTKVKPHYGLRLARTLFKILTLVTAALILFAIVSQIIEAIRSQQGELTSIFGVLSGDRLFYLLFFYAMYQISDIVLSINDNLRRMDDDAVRQLGRTNKLLREQNQKLIALLEQHHRRLEKIDRDKVL